MFADFGGGVGNRTPVLK